MMSDRHRTGRWPRGFSLLEVIIATAILAASAIMLMSMFATGDRHTKRATERTIAQMLCQSKLDELIADPAQLIAIPAEPVPNFPGWISTVEVLPTTLEGLVQVRVAVTHIPGTEVGADLSTSMTTGTSSVESNSIVPIVDVNGLSNLSQHATFELTRWLQYEGELTLDESMESTAPTTSLLERLQGE